MKLVMVYRDNEDYSRRTDEFIADFSRQTGHDIETLDPDTNDGKNFCLAYDIMAYPTLIAITSDGQVGQMWPVEFPTINEASFYVDEN